MGHLTGDHVDLVRMGRGDNHIGVAGSGLVENIGIAGKSGDALHVQRVCRTAHQFGIVVHNSDVVAFT